MATFPCPECGKVLRSAGGLGGHRKTCHDVVGSHPKRMYEPGNRLAGIPEDALPPASAEDVFSLSLRLLRWVLESEQTDLNSKLRAATIGARVGRQLDPGSVDQVGRDVDKLIGRVFGEGLRVVGDE